MNRLTSRPRRILAFAATLAVVCTIAIGVSAPPVAAESNEAPAGTESAIHGRIAGGQYDSCAVLDDGAVRCWGRNRYGQLGSTTNNGSETAIPTPEPAVDLGAGRTSTTATMGMNHTCAALDDGTVRCWGLNRYGQLGSTSNSGGFSPNPAPLPAVDVGAGRTVLDVVASDQHTCALLDDGTVRCWGLNRYGQLGSTANNGNFDANPTAQPAINLGSGRTATAITAGGNHVCALLDNGDVRCWGLNRSGQLGSTANNFNFNANPTPQPPVLFAAGRTATAISAGANHVCALMDNGDVRCWGNNGDGQLGSTLNNDTDNPNPTPQPAIDFGTGRTAVAIVADGAHSCARLDDGTVRCWGNNRYGQLGSTTNNGNDNANPTLQPAVDLGVGRTASALTAGTYHTCALLDDGTVRCWGSNRYGQLGSTTNNGNTTANPAPEPAVSLPTMTPDADWDGVADATDNCPLVANAAQADVDGDALGDACDDDSDNDGVDDVVDNCPLVANADQADADGDGAGDVCDNDSDNDGVDDAADNCPSVANADQANTDGDSQGDACDTDDDNDTVPDVTDNCPLVANADQADGDGDLIGDACDSDSDNDTVDDVVDNCPAVANTDQANTDGDSQGDACDTDDDNDTVLDATDNCPFSANSDQANNDGDAQGDACDDDDDNDTVLDATDNCQFTANADQADLDADGSGDSCDADDDNDTVDDVVDNCPAVANTDQANTDGDSQGDACDTDDDDDTVLDGADNCQFTANSDQVNTDGDAQGDACDDDDDNDTVDDATDNCPTTANTDQADLDSDGVGDACDTDTDNDTIDDASDNCPTVANTDQANNDGDSDGDACDTDDDNDTIDDVADNCPTTANTDQANNDGDSEGDACDTDDDNDTIDDVADNCPTTANTDQADLDSDGVGDACDTDNDNDTIDDESDNCPTVANPDQANNDGDTDGDACDTDDDNDTVLDGADNCQFTPNTDQANNDGDALGDACDTDDDNDTVLDATDNCQFTPNTDQLNTDGDAQGDACDMDDDNDTIHDGSDNCPVDPNSDQANNDGDALGDACDTDDDNDTVLDATDNCQFTPNTDQLNTDGDAQGDACDMDDDNDTIHDGSDNCPVDPNSDQANNDGDSQGDACDTDDDNDTIDDATDNCQFTPNADQADADGDGIGDACDPVDNVAPDVDAGDDRTVIVPSASDITLEATVVDDGLPNPPGATSITWTKVSGPGTVDFGDDGSTATTVELSAAGVYVLRITADDGELTTSDDITITAEPLDTDSDGVPDATDNCVETTNADQANNDGDSKGDACDPDDDNDTVLDAADNCGLTANADQSDIDGDGIGDACDDSSFSETFESVTAARLLETRVGSGFDTIDGAFEGNGRINGGSVLAVQITGRGGIPAGAKAAILNISTVNSAGNGFLTLFDCGAQPLASGINYTASGVVNNEIIAKLSTSGKLCVFAKTSTDVVIDAVGYSEATSPYQPITPARLVETRAAVDSDTVDDAFEGDGAIGSGSTYRVKIAGRGGIAGAADAAVLNLSTVGSAGNGFLTIFDCGTQPLASGINYTTSGVVNNEIITKLSAQGEICIFAKTTTHLVIDAVGYLPPSSDYTPITAARLVETRTGVNSDTVDDTFEGNGAIGGGNTYEVQVAGRGGIPADATSATLNLSTVGSAGNGFLTIYDCGERPLASGINYTASGVVNNEIVTKLSASGAICIFARTTTHLVVDAVGHL